MLGMGCLCRMGRVEGGWGVYGPGISRCGGNGGTGFVWTCLPWGEEREECRGDGEVG